MLDRSHKDNQIKLPPTSIRFMQESDTAFISIGNLLLEYLSLARPLNQISSIFDIGCGYGRLAYALVQNKNFSGQYVGLDILQKHIAWCQEAFNSLSNYTFIHMDIQNQRYNPYGKHDITKINDLNIVPMDIISFFSVFTHMYEDDIRLYLRLTNTCLKHNGNLICTAFLIDDVVRTAETQKKSQYPMTHKINDYTWYFNKKDPLHAIGYHTEELKKIFLQEGFQVKSIRNGNWSGRKVTKKPTMFQDLIIAEPI